MNDNEFFNSLQTSFSSSDSIDDILDELDNSKLVKKLIDWVQYTFTFFERSKIVKLFEDNDRKIYELQNKITTLLSSQNNLINQELI